MTNKYKIIAFTPETEKDVVAGIDIEADWTSFIRSIASQSGNANLVKDSIVNGLTIILIKNSNKKTDINRIINQIAQKTIKAIYEVISTPDFQSSSKIDIHTISPITALVEDDLDEIATLTGDKKHYGVLLKTFYSLSILSNLENIQPEQEQARFIESVEADWFTTMTKKSIDALTSRTFTITTISSFLLAATLTAVTPALSIYYLTGFSLISAAGLFKSIYDTITQPALKFAITEELLKPESTSISKTNGFKPKYNYQKTTAKFGPEQTAHFELPWYRNEKKTEISLPSLKPCTHSEQANEAVLAYTEANLIHPKDSKKEIKLNKLKEANFGGLAVLICPDDMDIEIVKEVAITITILFFGDDRFDKQDTPEGNSFSLVQKIVSQFKKCFIDDSKKTDYPDYKAIMKGIITKWINELDTTPIAELLAKRQKHVSLNNKEAEKLALYEKGLITIDEETHAISIDSKTEATLTTVYSTLFKLWADNGKKHRELLDSQSDGLTSDEKLNYVTQQLTNYLYINPIEVQSRTTETINTGVAKKLPRQVFTDRESSGAVLFVVSLILAHHGILLTKDETSHPSFIDLMKQTNIDYIILNDWHSLLKDLKDNIFDTNVMWAMILSELDDSEQVKILIAIQAIKSILNKETPAELKQAQRDKIAKYWGPNFSRYLEKAERSLETGEKLFSPTELNELMKLVNAANLSGKAISEAMRKSTSALQDRLTEAGDAFHADYMALRSFYQSAETPFTESRAKTIRDVALRGIFGQRVWYNNTIPYAPPGCTVTELQPHISNRYIHATST